MQYSKDDHAVWSILYTRQYAAVENAVYKNFLTGLQQLDFTAHTIPSFDHINSKLRKLTG